MVVKAAFNEFLTEDDVPLHVANQAVVAWFHQASSDDWGTMPEDWILVESWHNRQAYTHCRIFERCIDEVEGSVGKVRGLALVTETAGKVSRVEWERMPTGKYRKDREDYSPGAILKYSVGPDGHNRAKYSEPDPLEGKPEGFGGWS